MDLITISRLRAYRSCPRKEHYRYALCVKPLTTAEIIRFGTLFHDGKEAWRIARMEGGDPLDRALTTIHERWQADEQADEFELARVELAMIGYHHRYVDEPFKVLAVEAEFSMPLINPHTGRASRTWRQAGKIDAIVQDLRDGRIYAEETKTTGADITAGSPYWERLRIDGQISLYIDGARSLGFEAEGCLYDVIKRPAQRQLQATPEDKRKYRKDGGLYASQRAEDETPAEFRARVAEAIAADPEGYYVRGTVVRMGDELEAARRNVWLYARMIHDTRDHAAELFNPGACMQFGSPCSYWPVCSGEASLEDRSRYTVADSPHTELSQTQEPKEEAEDVEQQVANL